MFSSWKYSHYLEFVSAKDGNIKVGCTLCAGGDYITFEETFGVAALQSNLQSKSQQVVRSRKQEVPPHHHPNNKSWTSVQNQ